MAAEIIVVVEDEDAGGWPGGAAVEPGGRKPADAGTDKVSLSDGMPVSRKLNGVRLDRNSI